MPDPAVHDAASGRPSTSSSLSPSSSNAAAGGPIAASPGITSTSDHADESAAAPSVKPSPSPSSSPSTSSGATSRPSLLSRLSTPLHFPLPLRSRNRNLADFHIRCDEPHKKYSAGDSVRGAVVLALVKPLRITHLVVALHGYVRVLKEPTSVAKAQNVTILPPPGSSRRPEYRGNGVTSLFQDEQILSGEGRIEPGKYEFGFDLVFPGKRLPSSIDDYQFERGTISYTITATLTRPVSMAATSTCERKVTLVQQIDVGLLSAPRPRTIFLEPISKRTRRKKPKHSEMASGALPPPEHNDLTSEAGSVITEGSTRGETNNSNAPGDSTASDMHSEISVESRRSGVSSASRATGEFRQLSHVGSTLTSAAKQQYVDDKTITATIELIKGGCLPGDTVTVRVTVQHIKRVKSMTGVIVTLFRQSKIDTHPPKSMSHEGSRRRLTKQDPSVPRYRTGIGGLPFYSSGSISVFRKDLDQNAAPLIIDPATLQATVTVSVRVPDDAFPTIKGVPGDMISFKYLAEVIVDLGGRLTTQLTGGTSSLSRLGTPGGHNGDQNPMLPFGHQRVTNIADTSQVRAQKGVISVSLETVVGTTDSVKLRQPGKSNMARSRTIRIADEEGGDQDEEEDVDEDEYEYEEDDDGDDGDGGDITRRDTITRGKAPAYANGHLYSSPRERNHDYTSPPPHPPDDLRLTWAPTTASSNRLPHADRTYSLYPPHHPPPPPPSGAAPSYIPPPRVASEASMTEKERIRQAEMRLLPSQPPAGPATVADEEDIYGADDAVRRPTATPTVPASHAVEAEPSAPPVEDVIDAGIPAETSAGSPPRDKQELERQRLMQEASAPPEFPADMMAEVSAPHASASASAPPLVFEPTAPDLHEDDTGESYGGYGVGAGSSSGAGDSEQLPAYQR
ncbi:hypothetical protein E4U28_002358 [Claviceps purpurea]|nr:hypothetical protein E4U28_002358 [Claviceps purpurea]